MKVLDSNLWVMGTLDTNEIAVELLEAIETGTITSVMDEYVLAEVLSAFDRVLDGRARDRVLTAFLTRLHSMKGLVEAPEWRTQRSDQQRTILDYRRSRTAIAMLAQVFDVQIKDVPILVLAYEYRDRSPAVLTNDRSFSCFNPMAHNLSALSIEYVE